LKCGVPERSLHRWLAEGRSLIGAYRRARSAALPSASARLSTISTTAVCTLEELLGKKTEAAVRCRSALGILALATKLEEIENLVGRIERLERAAKVRAWPRLAQSGREEGS
jgi:hypothetical protein